MLIRLLINKPVGGRGGGNEGDEVKSPKKNERNIRVSTMWPANELWREGVGGGTLREEVITVASIRGGDSSERKGCVIFYIIVNGGNNVTSIQQRLKVVQKKSPPFLSWTNK